MYVSIYIQRHQHHKLFDPPSSRCSPPGTMPLLGIKWFLRWLLRSATASSRPRSPSLLMDFTCFLCFIWVFAIVLDLLRFGSCCMFGLNSLNPHSHELGSFGLAVLCHCRFPECHCKGAPSAAELSERAVQRHKCEQNLHAKHFGSLWMWPWCLRPHV